MDFLIINSPVSLDIAVYLREVSMHLTNVFVPSEYFENFKGRLAPKKNNFYFVSNDTMKGPQSRKKILKTMKISVTAKIHPLCTSGSERKFQMGPVGRGLRDVTRRLFIKNSTGKLCFLLSGLTIKKQGEWLQRSALGPPQL